VTPELEPHRRFLWAVTYRLTGSAADQVLEVLGNAEDSRRAASVVGFLGLLWGALGVVGALEQAFDATWQTTGRPGWRSKLVDLVWLVGAGALFLTSLALAPAVAALPGPATVPTVILGLALDVALFLWMFRALTSVSVPWSDYLPGAVVGGVGFEILKLVGGVLVPRLVSSSSALYGSLGVVFAILSWLALTARLIVYASALNVVLHEQRHGTVTVAIKVPRIEGEVPLATTRGGAVAQAAPDPPTAPAPIPASAAATEPTRGPTTAPDPTREPATEPTREPATAPEPTREPD
jgi:membrane protein